MNQETVVIFPFIESTHSCWIDLVNCAQIGFSNISVLKKNIEYIHKITNKALLHEYYLTE